ncbi:MAG: hypothetical protein P4K98_10045 [Bryobacteraceae bacterium]|nr:hypothetical protein [Bryobacteraceae bacterium]
MPVPNALVQERRIVTPNPDLLVVKVGERYGKLHISAKERASGILGRVAKVMTKPGTDRKRVFQSTSGKPVYAYSIYSGDVTKVVREDASGQQTIGQLVNGRFRPARAV